MWLKVALHVPGSHEGGHDLALPAPFETVSKVPSSPAMGDRFPQAASRPWRPGAW